MGPCLPARRRFGPVVSVRERRAGDQRLGRHEAEHVRQWRRYGEPEFLRRYLGAYLGLRFRCWPHWAAYRRIPFEVEAEWVARTAVRP